VDRIGAAGVIRVTLSRPTDLAALEARWRDLEAAADASFFQGWTWTGCLFAERFPDPVLAEATLDGRTMALALFNRRRGRLRDTLFLGESGDPARDRLYVEYNGVLVRAGADPDPTSACLRAARFARLPDDGWLSRPRGLVLSGIPDSVLAAAGAVAGRIRVRQSLPVPWVDLDRLRRSGTDYLASRSANTRQQLRRSDRSWAAAGGLALRRAATVAEALGFLEELEALHQAAWTARGQAGSFADPFFGRFHRTLIARGLPRGEIDLLRITAGTDPVGLLYNFRYRGRVLAYQSGFAYPPADARRKPGLTCHHLAIRAALTQGQTAYDFLAGADRYKYSLATDTGLLHWIRQGVSPTGREMAGWIRDRMVGIVRWPMRIVQRQAGSSV
jgi:CelD/BcsL family acetyltransferase involved in cellulose biosynthesis